MKVVETNLFGVRLCSSSVASMVDVLVRNAEKRESGYVCLANVDMITRAKRDGKLLFAMEQARYVVTDGMPLVWALRRKGLSRSEQVRGSSLMRALCVRFAAEGLPIFLYGGVNQAELQLLVEKLQQLAPDIQIAGAMVPPMLPQNPPFNKDIIKTINESGAKLVFIGLGCPKQEYWMLRHSSEIQSVCIGVGLAFALIAGVKAAAPEWMQRRGLEWMFRLFQEPRRLWKRYLVGNGLFLWYWLIERCTGSASPVL